MNPQTKTSEETSQAIHDSAGSIPPPDDAAHQGGMLVAELTQVNTLIGRYVLRFLDADAGRAEPLSTDDERALADRVTRAAEALRTRAARRALASNPPPLVEHHR